MYGSAKRQTQTELIQLLLSNGTEYQHQQKRIQIGTRIQAPTAWSESVHKFCVIKLTDTSALSFPRQQ